MAESHGHVKGDSQPLCCAEGGLPWGEAEGGAGGGECRRSSALWLFLDLRSALAALIFLGRPRFRPAIFLPFLFSFFFRALEGDGFLTVATPDFSSSAPESWRTQAGSEGPQQESSQGHRLGHPSLLAAPGLTGCLSHRRGLSGSCLALRDFGGRGRIALVLSLLPAPRCLLLLLKEHAG